MIGNPSTTCFPPLRAPQSERNPLIDDVRDLRSTRRCSRWEDLVMEEEERGGKEMSIHIPPTVTHNVYIYIYISLLQSSLTRKNFRRLIHHPFFSTLALHLRHHRFDSRLVDYVKKKNNPIVNFPHSSMGGTIPEIRS